MKDLEKEIYNIKNKINDINLDENFKKKLNSEITLEYEKQNKNDRKRFFYFPKQAVAVILCVVLLSGCVFADEIEHFVLSLFPNTNISVEEILENENLQKIDMEYIEKEGIKIKIDYALIEEDSIYLAFNVLSEENLKEIHFKEFYITDENENIVFSSDIVTLNEMNYSHSIKKINNKNLMYIIKIKNLNSNLNLKNIKKFKINLMLLKINNNKELNSDISFNIINK